MALATVTDIITMFPELTDVDSGTLQLYLDDAESIIVNEGIASSHSRFAQLQRYKTGSLLSGSGYLDSDTDGSESVADVSISKSGGGFDNSALYSNKWERLYHELKNNIVGLTNRLC